MSFVSDPKRDLIEAFTKEEEVKRIHELEKIIDNDEDLNRSFSEIKKIQKKMVLAKSKGDLKAYKEYNDFYNDKLSRFRDLPSVSEYFDLLEEVDLVLVNVSKTIEEEINKKIL